MTDEHIEDMLEYCPGIRKEDVLALIKRQRDEIERLKSSAKDIDVLTTKTETIRNLQDRLAVHFGTYTNKDKVLVRDVFELIIKFSEEILEEQE